MGDMDTVDLLRECDAGTKMAVASIDEVLDNVHDAQLKSLLTESKKNHEKIGKDAHRQLAAHQSEDKEPSPVAKGMSWIKTNLKLSMNGTDATVADLITDGCNMGTKSLSRYLNQYQAANEDAKNVCRELIRIEDRLCDGLRAYL